MTEERGYANLGGFQVDGGATGCARDTAGGHEGLKEHRGVAPNDDGHVGQERLQRLTLPMSRLCTQTKSEERVEYHTIEKRA